MAKKLPKAKSMALSTVGRKLGTSHSHKSMVAPVWRLRIDRYDKHLANEGYGIAVAVTGIILMATRIFDGVIDPIIALVLDKMNTRHGKIRIFMTAGWLIRAFAALLLFVWASGKGHGIALFVFMYLVYIIGSSMVDIAAQMIGPVMTNDPRQRPLVNVWTTVYNYLFPMAFTLITTLVILPMYGNEYTVPMLSTTCIFYVIGSGVLLLISFIGITPDR